GRGGVEKFAIKELFPRSLVFRSGDQSVELITEEDQPYFEHALKRFHREALTMKRLNHPNLVKVEDYFEHHGTGYILMPYVGSRTLNQLYKKEAKAGRGMHPDELVRIAIPLARGLIHAHEQHLFHRDISPDNVIIEDSGQPVLIDFGAAKQLQENYLQVTRGNSIPIVKDGFSPFEQYHYDGQIGSWTDIYAFCATLYTCLTGKKPPPSSQRKLEMLGSEKREPLKSLRPEGVGGRALSPVLIDTIHRGLALDIEDRTQSMEEVLSNLLKVRKKSAQRAKSPQRSPARNSPAGKDANRPRPEAQRKPAAQRNVPVPPAVACQPKPRPQAPLPPAAPQQATPQAPPRERVDHLQHSLLILIGVFALLIILLLVVLFLT
ncbi:MAG: serine/threonine-protein kinase, partial [Verrucomicrobiota bacterium]